MTTAQQSDADANRYRWLCEHPDWHFIEKLCQSFVAESAGEFYAALSAEIDRRMLMVKREGPFTEHVR